MAWWHWVLVWVGILAGTCYLYFFILQGLQAKAKRLLVQLQILESNVSELTSAIATPGSFQAGPSAIEEGAVKVVSDLVRVRHRREQAKAARRRRLISGLRNLSRKASDRA